MLNIHVIDPLRRSGGGRLSLSTS